MPQPAIFVILCHKLIGSPGADITTIHIIGVTWNWVLVILENKLRNLLTRKDAAELFVTSLLEASKTKRLTLIQSATFGSSRTSPFHSEQRRPLSTIGTSHEAINTAQPEQIQDTDLHSRYQLTVSDTTTDYHGCNTTCTAHQATCCGQILYYTNADIDRNRWL